MDNATNLQQNGQPNEQPAIIRTGRGLTIAGMRTTLYRIMDYVKAGWPPKLIWRATPPSSGEQMPETAGWKSCRCG